MSSKLITVSVLSIMLWCSTASAMDSVPVDPSQSQNSNLSPISPNQTDKEQFNPSEMMEMLRSMQTSIQDLSLKVQSLNQRMTRVAASVGLCDFENDIKLSEIIRMAPEAKRLKDEADVLAHEGRYKFGLRAGYDDLTKSQRAFQSEVLSRYDTPSYRSVSKKYECYPIPEDATEEEKAVLESLNKKRQAEKEAEEAKREAEIKAKTQAREERIKLGNERWEELKARVKEYIEEARLSAKTSTKEEDRLLAEVRIVKALEQVGAVRIYARRESYPSSSDKSLMTERYYDPNWKGDGSELFCELGGIWGDKK